jgi:hypothetical protein
MTRRGDGLRERDRYGRASLREQLGDEVRALRGQPWLILVITLIVGGAAILLITRPQVVRVPALVAGDCLYIHAADAKDDPPGRRIGTDTGVVIALYEAGAERASCDMSHSHEVAAVPAFEENAVAAYPGSGTLTDRIRDTCATAFTAYVGRAPDASEFDLVIAVPPEPAWTDGIRLGACLVNRDDGEFMGNRAAGSGR